jgi:hypothetical protein
VLNAYPSQKYRERAEECRRLATGTSSTPDELLSFAKEREGVAEIADNLAIIDAMTESAQESLNGKHTH